jgi:hypothetical protein
MAAAEPKETIKSGSDLQNCVRAEFSKHAEEVKRDSQDIQHRKLELNASVRISSFVLMLLL